MKYYHDVALLLFAAAWLTGCGGRAGLPSTPAIGQTTSGWMSPEARSGERLIYVANGNNILVFPDRIHDPSVIGRITSGVEGAQGLCVDSGHNLYVVNGWSGTVTVYPQGSITPSMTYTGLSTPEYPVVDLKGNLFVSSYYGNTVTEFRPGHPKAYRTLRITGNGDGIAVDRRGDLFVAFRTTYRLGGLDEFLPGSTHPRVLPISLDQPQGLLVTSDGTIVVVQTGNADGVYIIDPNKPRTNQFVRGIKFDVHQTPVQVAISSDESRLFVSEFGWTGEGSVFEAKYPIVQNAPALRVFREKLKLVRHGPKRHFSIQGMAISDGDVQ